MCMYYIIQKDILLTMNKIRFIDVEGFIPELRLGASPVGREKLTQAETNFSIIYY